MLNKLVLAAFAASLFVGPAHATQGMGCVAPDDPAGISLLRGSAGGFGAIAASMWVGQAQWTTDAVYGDGTIFTIGQGFADRTRLDADFFDDIVNEKVAELRLVRSEEGDDIVLAGTLRIIGHGVWPVICDEE